MSNYSTTQYIADLIRTLGLAIFLDWLVAPGLFDVHLAFIEWLGLIVLAQVALMSLGFSFGLGQTRGTLVETETYGRGDRGA